MSKPSKVFIQNEFVRSLVRLLTWLDVNGYMVSLGEAFRPAETAALYAQQGKGIVHSLHTDRLAIDLNLFRNEALLISVDDYSPAGEFWESLSVPELEHCWGGRFHRPDADHFSIGYEGRK